MLSGKNSWAPVKRDFGTQVRLLPSAAISINEPPLALLLRRDPRTNEILSWRLFYGYFLRRKEMKTLFFIANHPAPKELEAEYEVVALTTSKREYGLLSPKQGFLPI